ncbi:MAG: hypothetical protein WBM71_04350 [Sedimenticolaceae bacterium]|jgi:hypothetical protein
MTKHKHALMFFYNAEGGLFNTMADIGHKIFSPDTCECAVCPDTRLFHRAWTIA